MPQRYAYITRKETFCASHQLFSENHTAEENEKLYGQCSKNHGHTYILEVTLRGPLDPKTGMVMNIFEIKKLTDKVVMDQMDHTNLNDLSYFKNIPTTLENTAIYIWDQLKELLEKPKYLYEVKLYETAYGVIYRGQTSINYREQRSSADSITSDSD